MSARLIFGLALVLAISTNGFSQQAQTPNAAEARVAGVNPGPVKQDLLQTISIEEAAVRQAEAAHHTNVQLGRLYWNLGLAYEDAAQWGRSEASLAHSVVLFRRDGDDAGELATALDALAVLHVGLGKLRASEKEEDEALDLREKLGDQLQIAKSWETLAAILLKQHKYEKARDFAAKAMAEFKANAKADEADRISSQYALGMALCGAKDCASAVQILKKAVDEARAKLPADDLPIGIGEFLLGCAYWKSGDMTSAGREMQPGVAVISERLGPRHPTYVSALGLYGKYLREAGNVEAANDVERQVRQAEAVVDVHTLQSGQAALGFDGLR